MKTFTDHKIDEVYEVALKLGIELATDMEKDIFKKALRQIAVAAIDDVRHNIESLMHNESNRYINANAENESSGTKKMENPDLADLSTRSVCFFKLKNGKYLTENNMEITTDMLVKYPHQITDVYSFIVLD